METKELIAKIEALREDMRIHLPACKGSVTPEWAENLSATQFHELRAHYGITYLFESSSGHMQSMIGVSDPMSIWIQTPHTYTNRYDLAAELNRMVKEEEQSAAQTSAAA